MTSSNTYYYTKVMSNLFLSTAVDTGVTFQTIRSMADFWNVSRTKRIMLLYYNSEMYKTSWIMPQGVVYSHIMLNNTQILLLARMKMFF